MRCFLFICSLCRNTWNGFVTCSLVTLMVKKLNRIISKCAIGHSNYFICNITPTHRVHAHRFGTHRRTCRSNRAAVNQNSCKFKFLVTWLCFHRTQNFKEFPNVRVWPVRGNQHARIITRSPWPPAAPACPSHEMFAPCFDPGA